MTVSITDEGTGFDFVNRVGAINSEELFKSCGRGLLLISSLMDEVGFNETGNEIRMVKKRVEPQASVVPAMGAA
jgi:serine/threonine-protein kinase RsbW